MTEFVNKIDNKSLAAARAYSDWSGNAIADTYATKTEGAKVSVSEGSTPDYLVNVLQAGDGMSITQSDATLVASANIEIIQFRSKMTADDFNNLYDKLVNGHAVLFCRYSSCLYPMVYFNTGKISFSGMDYTSNYRSKARYLDLNADGSWNESAQIFFPSIEKGGALAQGGVSKGTKTLTAKTGGYWTGYWVPIFSIPIGRFALRISAYDTLSAYNTSYNIDLFGIDKYWLTASYSCLNPSKDCLRIWQDGSNWFVGFDGSALSDSGHIITYTITGANTFSFTAITDETRVDPSTVSVSGVHLQRPVANTIPDWSQTAPTDTATLNPDQGSTELT